MWVAQRALDLAYSEADYVTQVAFVPSAEALGITTPAAAAASASEPPTERTEALLCGCNDGRVFAVGISAMAAAEDTSGTRSSAGADEASKLVEKEFITPMWRHRGCVLGLHVHESLIATCDETGTIAIAAGGNVVVELEHCPTVVQEEQERSRGKPKKQQAVADPDEVKAVGDSAVRQVMLWDGFGSWSAGCDDGDSDDEPECVYVFAAIDDGYVRLWRVNVVKGRGEVIAVFGPPQLFDAATGRDARPNIFSLVLDLDPANGTPHGRLVAGTANSWCAWDLSTLTPRGVQRPAVSTVADTPVWAMDYAVVEAAHGALLKPKVRGVVGGRSIGAVASGTAGLDLARELASPCAKRPAGVSAGVPPVGVAFPSLRKDVVWPASVVRAVVPAQAWGAHHAGPVYAWSRLGYGRLASAGADGVVCVVRWAHNPADSAIGGANTGARYCLENALKGHTDLVKALLPTGSQHALMSAGYDGTVRMWHTPDEAQLSRCASVLLVEQGSQPLTTEQVAKDRSLVLGGGVECDASKRETARHSIACAALFPEASVLFTVSLFERVVRSFMLLEVDSCDPPPGFVYNGARTICVKLEDADRSAEGPSTTSIDPFGAQRGNDEAAARHPLFGHGEAAESERQRLSLVQPLASSSDDDR